MSAPDVASASPRHLAGWVPPIIGLATFLLLVVPLGVLAADWMSRSLEMDRLVTAIEQSEDEMSRTQDAVAAAYALIEGDTQITATDRAAVDKALRAAAEQGRTRIGDAGDVVAAVRVMSWHGSVQQARDAYVAHNRAWQDYLGRAALDPAEFLADQPEVNDSFMAVEPLLTDAVPVPPLFDLDQRVADIFTEGAPQDVPTQTVALVS